jgi:hypothetical protein
VGFLDDHAQFVLGELAAAHRGARSGEPAAGHDLHDVGPALGSFAHGAAQLLVAGGLTAHRPAVTLLAGDGWTGTEHALPVPVALVDHRPPVVAEVAHGRDACPQLPVEAFLDHRVQLLGRITRQALESAVLAVTAEVHVGVDQSW